jgi:hypothetical protein
MQGGHCAQSDSVEGPFTVSGNLSWQYGNDECAVFISSAPAVLSRPPPAACTSCSYAQYASSADAPAPMLHLRSETRSW